MKVLRNRLSSDDGTPLPFLKSPNVGRNLIAEYLVIHYTAGKSAEGAISWLRDKKSNASAHVVIARNGKITQLVPFNKIAFHAGVSYWEGRNGLNRYSIGIELDNAGLLKRHGDKWVSWFGTHYEDEEVIEAVHKNDTKSYGWHLFTPEQIDAALEIGSLLFDKYRLVDVVGHDDISPKRKWDPGPAFPMESFRSRLLGRKLDEAPTYVALFDLTLRTGPAATAAKVIDDVIPEGTRFEVTTSVDGWRYVDVLDEVSGETDLSGWVIGRGIKRKTEE